MTSDGFFCSPREQSIVKTRIVIKYFKSWARIMKSRSRDGRLGYMDLFCGPGIFEDGTKSTPVEILELAIEDKSIGDKLVTIFNDKELEHIEALKSVIKSIPGIEQLKYAPNISCREVGEEIAKDIEGMDLIPCLTFIDPCGYKGLTLRLISSCTKDWGCDCILFFNTNRLRMAITNPKVETLIDDLFGKEAAEELRQTISRLPREEREPQIIEAFCESLIRSGSKYVLPFRFEAVQRERTSHHLIFATKNFTAYSIMKGIMYTESTEREEGIASFGYTPATKNQPRLFSLLSTLGNMKEELLEGYKGRTLTVKELYEEHSVGRPYILKNYQDVLRELEEENRITADPIASKRRLYAGRVTFPEYVKVTFP